MGMIPVVPSTAKLSLFIQQFSCGSWQDVCSLSLLSAAVAAATEGGKCIKLSVAFSSLEGAGATLNKDSTSLSVKMGWSWFFLFPLTNEPIFLLLFSLYMLSSTVSFTYYKKDSKKKENLMHHPQWRIHHM